MIAGSIIKNKIEEIPSNLQLCFVGKLCIMFFTASSSTLLIFKLGVFVYLGNNKICLVPSYLISFTIV